ncbi:hypothetical protein [Thalassotalea montiporae]
MNRFSLNGYWGLGLLILAFATLAYWPSMSVPFYLDDRISIAENELLKSGTLTELWDYYGLRFLTYLTFWGNERYFDGSLLSYHLVNFLIHLSNGILAFIVIRLFAQNSALHNNNQAILFSMACVAIWLLHPLNTQAVTYIVQRAASLATFFWLLTLVSYLQIRFYKPTILRLFFFIISICFGVLTKQNYITIFVYILLCELFFFKPFDRSKVLQTIGLAGVLFALAYPFISDTLILLDKLTRETTQFTRGEYFATQAVVLWLYIAKAFYPIGLQLDMNVGLYLTNSPSVYWAFICHLAVIFTSVILRRHIPLLLIGVLWFYSAHIVESSLIPITDLAFEHRSYLPNIGLVIALVALLNFLISGNRKKIVLLLLVLVSTISLSSLTYHRNVLWQDSYQFYKHELEITPESTRTMESYALELIKRGEEAEAEDLLLKAVNINFKNGIVRVSALENLMALLFKRRRYQTGIQTAMLGLKYVHKPKERSQLLAILAYGYVKMGGCDFAISLSNASLKLNAHNVQAAKNIKVCN